MKSTSTKVRILSIVLAIMMTLGILPLSVSAEAAPIYGDDFALGEGFTLDNQDHDIILHAGAETSMALGRTVGRAGDVFTLSALVKGEGSGSITTDNGAALVLTPSADYTQLSTQFTVDADGVIKLALTVTNELCIKDITLNKAMDATELVPNGDFEGMGGFGDGVEGTAASGKKALNIGPTNMYTKQITVPIEKNTWYLYSADMMRERDGHWLYVDMCDIDGELQLRAKSAGVWEHAAGIWFSGERTSVELRIVVELNYDDPSNGTIDASNSYIDNISFKKVSAGDNLIADPSFDKNGWTVTGGNVSTSIYYSANSALVSDASGEMTATANDAITLKANTSYVLSGYMLRANKGILSGNAAQGAKTATGSVIVTDGDQTIAAAYAGRYNATAWNTSAGKTNWEHFSISFNSGSHTSVNLAAHVSKDADTVTDIVAFDDLVLKEINSADSVNRLFAKGEVDTSAADKTDASNGIYYHFNASDDFESALITAAKAKGDLEYALYTWKGSPALSKKNMLASGTAPFIGGLAAADFGAMPAGEYLLYVKFDGSVYFDKSDISNVYFDKFYYKDSAISAQICMAGAGAQLAATNSDFFGGLFIDASTVSGQTDLIKWQKIGEKYYLFVPACADISALKLYVNGTSTALLAGNEIVNGEPTAALADGKEHTLTACSNTYTVIAMQSENIPAVFINTKSGNMDYINAKKGNKESGYTVIVDADGKVEYDNTLDQIKGRGNSTWTCEKKPYNLKLAKKTNLFGLGKSKKWSILANYYDQSLIRNSIMYDLAAEVGIRSHDCKTVDVYFNGEYNGNYLLTEKVDIEETKVNIENMQDRTEEANPDIDIEKCPLAGDRSTNPGARKYVDIPNDPEDITGGFILEFDFQDRYAEEISGFVTNRGQCVVVKEPEYATKAQVNYIADYFQHFEDALYSETGYNDLGKHYSEYCDVDSLARHYLLQELALNIDAAVTSFFFCKDSDLSADSMMYCDPTWDFDAAIGNFNDNRYGYNTTDPTVWYVRNGKIWQNQALPSYLAQAYSQPEVYNSVIKVWNNEFLPNLAVVMSEDENVTSADGRLKSITGYAAELAASARMNFTLWDILSQDSRGVDTGKTIEANIDYVKNFFNVRVPLMNKDFGSSVTGIALEKDSAQIGVGASVTIKPIITPADATMKDVTYTSSDEEVAAVDKDGVVTGLKEGSAVITVKTMDGGLTAKFNVTVKKLVASVEIKGAKSSMKIGEQLDLTAIVLPEDASDKSVIWTSGNTDVLNVSKSGQVTAVGAGKATITATSVLDPAVKASVEIEVDEPLSAIAIEGEYSVIAGSTAQYIVTTTPIDAENSVTWSVVNFTGEAAIDENGLLTATKEGTVIVAARSTVDYAIVAYKAATVLPRISISTLKVKLAATLYTYDGKVKKPAVTVTDAKGKKIASSNYTVTYASGRKLPGTYTVKVTMKGSYTGSKTLTFAIRGKQMSVSKLTALSKGFKATWAKQSYVTGYQVQYSTSSKFTAKTTKTATISKYTTTSKTVTKLKAKTKYYVRVRSYKTTKISGKNYNVYSAWSKAKAVTTKK